MAYYIIIYYINRRFLSYRSSHSCTVRHIRLSKTHGPSEFERTIRSSPPLNYTRIPSVVQNVLPSMFHQSRFWGRGIFIRYEGWCSSYPVIACSKGLMYIKFTKEDRSCFPFVYSAFVPLKSSLGLSYLPELRVLATIVIALFCWVTNAGLILSVFWVALGNRSNLWSSFGK